MCDSMLAPKGIDVEQQSYEDIANVSEEWFEDGDIDGLEQIDLSKGDLRIVRFILRQRVGFYLPNGDSFSVPEKMLQGKLTKYIYDKLVENFGVEVSKELQTPLVLRNNALLYKKFEQLGFKVMKPLLDRLSNSLDSASDKQENMNFLIGYLYNEAIRTNGLSRLDLRLNTNTQYYQKKASKLAELQDGVGQWSLVDVKYHIGKFSKCSLGHRIKWEFVVEELTTGERLSFGSTCIDDFFLVDSEIKGQVRKYKTYILNRLIEYAMQYDMGTVTNLRVDRWVSVFGLGLRGLASEVDYQLDYIQEFVRRGLLIPISLQREYIESVLTTGAKTKLIDYKIALLDKLSFRGDIDRNLQVLLSLGLQGNLSTYLGDSEYELASKNNDKLNLYGLKTEKLAKLADELYDLERHLKKALLKTDYARVFKILEECKDYDNYVTLVHNIIGVGTKLVELQERLYFTGGRWESDFTYFFGVHVKLQGRVKGISQLILAMNGYKEDDILNTEKVLDIKLHLSKIENEDDRLILQVLHKLFSKKNLDYDMTVGVDVTKRDYYEELKPLLHYSNPDKPYVYPLRKGTYTGNLKKEVLQQFLEEYIGKTLEEVTLEIQETKVEAAKSYYRRGTNGNVYTNTVDIWGDDVDSEHKTEDGRWSESKVNLEELTREDFVAAFKRAKDRPDLANRPLEFYRLVQHLILNIPEVRSLVNEFGYRVLTTCIENRKCSAKQLVYVDKLVKKLAVALKPQFKQGNALVDIYLEIVYGAK